MTEINNTDDIIDSRDIEPRIEELNNELLELYNNEHPDATIEEIETDEVRKWLETEDTVTYNDWLSLSAFWEEIKDNIDEGESLINSDYFTDYTEELCKDCGYISNDFPRFIEIDWDATAENVKDDYTAADYDGTTFYYRAG